MLSWDFNKERNTAKLIAKENVPNIFWFHCLLYDDCKHQHSKDVVDRLSGHSLGPRLILSTLDNLHKNSLWNNNNYKISSVHLLWASVALEVSTKPLDITNDFTNDIAVKSAYGKGYRRSH